MTKIQIFGSKIFSTKFFLLFIINILIVGVFLFFFIPKPTLESIDEISINRKSGDSLFVKLKLSVRNPNFFTISGKNVRLKLLNESNLLVEGVVSGFALKPFQTDTLEYNCFFLLKNLLTAYKNSPKVFKNTIEFNGSFTPLFFLKNFAVENSFDKSKIESLIFSFFFNEEHLHFDSLRFLPISPKESKITCSIVLYNSLDLKFTLKKIEIEIYPTEKSNNIIGTWKLEEKVEILADQMNNINCSLTIDNFALLLSGFEKNKTNYNTVFVKGKITAMIDNVIFEAPISSTVKIAANK